MNEEEGLDRGLEDKDCVVIRRLVELGETVTQPRPQLLQSQLLTEARQLNLTLVL